VECLAYFRRHILTLLGWLLLTWTYKPSEEQRQSVRLQHLAFSGQNCENIVGRKEYIPPYATVQVNILALLLTKLGNEMCRVLTKRRA